MSLFSWFKKKEVSNTRKRPKLPVSADARIIFTLNKDGKVDVHYDWENPNDEDVKRFVENLSGLLCSLQTAYYHTHLASQMLEYSETNGTKDLIEAVNELTLKHINDRLMNFYEKFKGDRRMSVLPRDVFKIDSRGNS